MNTNATSNITNAPMLDKVKAGKVPGLSPVKGITPEALKAAGITYPNKRAVKAVVDSIRLNGGYVPEGISETGLALVAAVGTGTKAIENAKRTIAISVALMEETGEYANLLAPSGKPFKSARDLFRAAYPALADSTIRNYLDIGRNLYLPALRNELSPTLKALAERDPGTVQAAMSSLKDDTKRKAFEKALSEVKPGPKGYTSKQVSDAVKAVKAVNKPDKSKENGTVLTDKKAAKAAGEERLEAVRVALKQALAPDWTEGELHMTVGEERVARFMSTVKTATADGEAALLFVKALYAALQK